MEVKLDFRQFLRAIYRLPYFGGRFSLCKSSNRMSSVTKRPHINLIENISPNKNNNLSPKRKAKKVCPNTESLLQKFNGVNGSSPNKLNNVAVINGLKKNDKDLPALDLSKWQRCRVTNVVKDVKTRDLILSVCNHSCNELEDTCRLQGPWSFTRIAVNDLVSILAFWNEKLNCYTVDMQNGFIITNPDLLVPVTSVVGSLFCPRKAVIQNKFEILDGDATIMVIGSMIHDVFQKSLMEDLRTYEEIENLFKEFISSRETMFNLYSGNISLDVATTEMQKFIPNIVNFIEQYIYPKNKKNNANNGKILYDVEDIEENIWIPQFGLKGKVDVSVKIHEDKTNKKIIEKFPLELKTGRASFSAEHKGQLVLYQMMLNELQQHIKSGLLLYLREDAMKEIQAPRNDQRDLILSRNDLSYYLSQSYIKPQNNLEADEGNLNSLTIKLPPPIHHRNACTRCQYKTICTSLYKFENTEQLPSSHPIIEIAKNCLNHLNSNDLEYFNLWCNLNLLEEQNSNTYSGATLWTQTPEKRQKLGKALNNLKVNGNVVYDNGRYIHELVANEEKFEIHNFQLFQVGEYVLISTSKRFAIATGFVQNAQPSSIQIALDRNLGAFEDQQVFIVDKTESSSNMKFSYTNLGILLNDTEISNNLRSIVVGRKNPTFQTVQLPSKSQYMKILESLNPVQKHAVSKALSAENYMLIKGLPGTGKTQTLVAIVRLLNMLGKSVLITSHTHTAVDNLLLRLKHHNMKCLRIGSETRINPQLQEFSEKNLTAKISDVNELKDFYSSQNIVGVTCLGCNHNIFSHRNFDVCIVDEATQVYQPVVLRPLFFAKKFILVGDPDQLPPLIRSVEAKKFGADQSLFHRLDSDAATSILTLQYRMNKTITKLANDLTYQGKLKCANDMVSSSNLKLPNEKIFWENYGQQNWILMALAKHIDQSVVLMDTKDCSKLNDQFFEDINQSNDKRISNTNYCDAGIVIELLKALITAGCTADRIGVIAPYRAQVELLNNLVKNCKHINLDNLEVHTVDQYQGKDKDIIIYSGTQTGKPVKYADKIENKNEVLEDRRRLTVAITRCKQKLIIIGDEMCLLEFGPFKDLLTKIPKRCKIVLENGKRGFTWNSVLENLRKTI